MEERWNFEEVKFLQLWLQTNHRLQQESEVV